VVRDDQHGKALDAAGVARVLNPFTDAADFAARSLIEELGSTPRPPTDQVPTRPV